MKFKDTKVINIRNWDEFKKSIRKLMPKWIAYYIMHAPLCRPPLGIRLHFIVNGNQYIFLDLAYINAFRKTKLPIHTDAKGKEYLKEEEIKKFLRTELNQKDLSIVRFY